MQEVKKHLEELVNIYPVTSNQQSVSKALEYCQGALVSAGFDDVHIIKNNGISSLYASTTGEKHTKLLLQGHIDVVPASEHMRKFTEKDNRFYGRGTYDMLFGTACFLAAVSELREELPDLDLGIMLTGDEEIGGFDGVKKLVEEGYSCDICLLPDAGDGIGSLSVAAKGIFSFDIVVSGKSHHGSRPWEGDNAATKLVNLLKELTDEFPLQDRNDATITIAQLNAGHAMNQGPESATAHLDIRYPNNHQLQKIQKKIDELNKKYDGRIENLLQESEFKLDENSDIAKAFINLYEEFIGDKITKTKAHGSSDARFFNAKDIPVMMMRPKGFGAHSEEEWIDKDELEKFYELTKKTILKFARR